MESDLSVYDAVGGMPFFVALVDRFYARVAHDIMLRPLYPDDLGPPVQIRLGAAVLGDQILNLCPNLGWRGALGVLLALRQRRARPKAERRGGGGGDRE